jgi:hypothetical protein
MQDSRLNSSDRSASAHLAVDVQDTLAELAGQFMKIERDNLGVKLIQDAAVESGLPRCLI